MQKNLSLKGWYVRRPAELPVLIVRAMRITIFLTLACVVNVYATGYSQERLTLSLKDVKLSQVFSVIQQQTDYQFLYNDEDVQKAPPVSVSVQNATVPQILEACFKNYPLSYRIEDKTVVVLPALEKAALSLPAKITVPQFVVKGRVSDQSGAPLAGVSVSLKGTQTGTITDARGDYSLTLENAGGTLVFSYVGYQDKEEPVNGRPTINVLLKPSVASLDQLVVVGYGSQKKSDLTGSVVSLGKDDLNSGGTVSNVAQTIQGRAAGVEVKQNSGEPGGSISIRIRGSNSISSSNEPLYVVDGFPTTNGLDINPNDVASIQILKDASATAIYGSRGANGVILITTKRGRAGENHISYNGYVGVQQLAPSPFHMLNGKQYMNLANDLYKEIDGQENQEYGVYTASQLESDVNTDWIKATTRLGVVQDHNLQFLGGGQHTKVLTSVGYFNQEGTLKNTNFSRISGRVNVDQEINDYVRAGASLSAQRENSNVQGYEGNLVGSNVLYSILTYSPVIPVYNDDGSFARPPGGRGDNPLANLLSRQNDMQIDKLDGNIFLEITPVKGLTIRTDGGAEALHVEGGTYLPRSTYQGGIDEGDASLFNASSTHELFDAFVTYKNKIRDNHSFSIMGGYSYEFFSDISRGSNAYGFSTDQYSYHNIGTAATITGIKSNKSEHLLVSFFGRLDYSFKDKYLLTFTLRRDGSSRFGTDHRWGTFPSGAFAWKLDEEPFIQNLNLFSNLKLRLGYGVTGNERIGNYSSYALISSTHVTFDGTTSTPGTILNPSTPENPRLKWESTAQYNIGLDMGFLDSRISATMDAYYKKTSDLLIRVGVPYYSGFTSGLKNVGTVENKGFELDISSRNLVGAFKWSTKINFSLNRNKVLGLGGESDILLESNKPMGTVSDEDFAIIREGEPIGSLYGYVYTGVIQEGEKYTPQPNAKPGDPKFKDISGPDGKPDGLITSADRTIIGQAYPKFRYGILNTFSYKHFDLSIFAYGAQGNDLMNMTRMMLEWQKTTKALDRWTPGNTNTDIPRNGFFYSKYGGYINTHFLEDASFLRLKNLTLGYTVTIKGLQSFRVYLMAENLVTLTHYTGWDPEVDTKGYENDPKSAGYYTGFHTGSDTETANAGVGLDFNSYPGTRALTLGLNVTF